MRTEHTQSDLKVAGILLEILGHGHGMIDPDTLTKEVSEAIIEIIYQATGGSLSICPVDLSENGAN